MHDLDKPYVAVASASEHHFFSMMFFIGVIAGFGVGNSHREKPDMKNDMNRLIVSLPIFGMWPQSCAFETSPYLQRGFSA